MSFVLNARMAQFETKILARVDRPGDPFDPNVVAAGYPDDIAHLATVHWVVQPELGLPAAPFEVELCPQPLPADGPNSWAADGEVRLSGGRRDLPFQNPLRQLNASDALCVTAATDAADGIEIFANDASGAEIAETRRSANAPLGTAFLGPGILGLRTTGDVTLRNLKLFALPSAVELEFVQMATVAPALHVGNYEPQRYLGRDYSVDDALQVRLAMDAFARANTAPPHSRVLDSEIYREDTRAIAGRAIASKPMREIERDFAAYLADPAKSFDEPLTPDVTASICPCKMLQMLALSDPVTATALGTAVTIPVPKPFRYLSSLQEVYEAVERERALPFPIVRLRAHHLTAENYGLAGLVLCPTVSAASIKATDIQAPVRRDEAATASLHIAIDRAPIGLASFIGFEPDLEQFRRDQDNRIIHYLASGLPEDRSAAGRSSIRIGGVKLPLTAREMHTLGLRTRDMFGRWPVPVEPLFALDPWPVQMPGCGPIEQEFGEDGIVAIHATLKWDWSKRTPLEIRIGMKLMAIGAGEVVYPQDGVNLPGVAAVPLAITFAADGTPRLPANIPDGWAIKAISSTYGQAAASGADLRSYRLRIALGTAFAVFGHDYQREVVLSADAWEAVSGQTPDRRSKAASSSATLHDPRPPILTVEPWKLEWSSRVDGANVARAYFDPRSLVATPVAGFFTWRAHEAAIIDVAVGATVSDADEAERLITQLRSERDMAVRLAAIQGLCEQHLHKPEFVTAFINCFEVDDERVQTGPCEIHISGARTGLEFVMITALSKANVASKKSCLAGIRGIAVPAERAMNAPMLRISRPRETSVLARSGLCIASIGAGAPFAADEARIFWDDDPTVVSADELLHKLTPVSELSLAQAAVHVADIAAVLKRIGATVWRHFLIKLPESWQAHHFTADMSRSSASSPADRVASPRADIQRLRLQPVLGPTLKPNEPAITAGVRTWTIGTDNIFVDVAHGMLECKIQLQLVQDQGLTVSSETIGFAAFQRTGLQVSDGGHRVSARAGATPRQIVIEAPATMAGKSIRLAASDPAGRIDALVLSG